MAVDTLPEGFTLNEPVGGGELPAGFTINEPAPQPVEEMVPQDGGGFMEKVETFGQSIPRGLSLGFSDELAKPIQAGIMALRGAEDPWGEAERLRQGRVQNLEELQQRNPIAGMAGEIIPAIATGAVGGSLLPAGAKAYAVSKPIRAAAGTGAVSGGVYGAGTGEGGAIERAKQAGEYGVYGAGGGVIGGALLSRAKSILGRKRAAKAQTATLQEVAERADEVIPVEGGEKAFGKVAKALKKDLGADYEDVLNAYKTGDVSLAELNQSRTRTLAQGAAQYSGGKAKAQEFFDPKIAGSYDRVLKNVRENVTGVESYHTTADDLLAAGRAKAAPLYDEAYDEFVGIGDDAQTLYHGTNATFDNIDPLMQKRDNLGKGVSFTSSKNLAKTIGRNVKELNLVLKNTFDTEKATLLDYKKLYKKAGKEIPDDIIKAFKVLDEEFSRSGIPSPTNQAIPREIAMKDLGSFEKYGYDSLRTYYMGADEILVYDLDKVMNYPAITAEVSTAIAKARRQFPSELEGLKDNSVKVLDYAKRVLDDDINTAQRAGKGNLARSRVSVKNELLKTMDEQVPAYKKARAVSGDYLQINNAMEQGRKALKTDSELLAKQFKSLSDPEKQAYQIGLGKAIRDEVGKVAEGANPFRRILGSPEKVKRIASVLSPVQFKKLEAGLRAEDRLFKMRNEILGGSPTSGKEEAKNLIATTTQGVDDILQIPRKAMISGLQKFRLGLNDNTASKVSEILYETDPIKKLEILNKLKSSKDFTPQEVQIIKKTYFDSADKFDVLRAGGAAAGGITPAVIGE